MLFLALPAHPAYHQMARPRAFCSLSDLFTRVDDMRQVIAQWDQRRIIQNVGCRRATGTVAKVKWMSQPSIVYKVKGSGFSTRYFSHFHLLRLLSIHRYHKSILSQTSKALQPRPPTWLSYGTSKNATLRLHLQHLPPFPTLQLPASHQCHIVLKECRHSKGLAVKMPHVRQPVVARLSKRQR